MKDIAVFYLLRKKNKKTCFFEFIESYTANQAGLKHDLFIILKGFNINDDISWVASKLKGIDYKTINCPDRGFDIYAYFYSAKRINHEYVMFLNSFSIICSQDWLNKIFQCINEKVIAVGCSGSWESVSSSFYYNHIYTNSDTFKKALNLLLYPFIAMLFPRFPSSHLRTNAFLIKRELFLKYNHHIPYLFKLQAWLFENGRNSLSAFIRKQKKSFGVVDNNGLFFNEEGLFSSKTFANPNGQNAIIVDNQIKNFIQLNSQQKEIKSNLNWNISRLYN